MILSPANHNQFPQHPQQQVDPLAPYAALFVSPGFPPLQAHCASVYPPETQTPLCLRPQQSFILQGGDDPLECIYIYKNEGDEARKVPQHWHYVGFGLSDLYGYRHLYDCSRESHTPLPQLFPLQKDGAEQLNGFGIELTFRVRCNDSTSWMEEPPRWPAQVMQALARYVYGSKNVFNVDDHTAWRCSLDGEDDGRIEHLLMTLDPQLGEVETNLGWVKFIQLVGVCQEELIVAREWNPRGVLDLMKERIETGGEYLVTDMTRGATIIELEPANQERIYDGIAKTGSNMTCINVRFNYSSRLPKCLKEVENVQMLNGDEANDDDELECFQESRRFIDNNPQPGVEKGNLLTMTRHDSRQSIAQDGYPRAHSSMSYESESELLIDNAELANTRFYDSIQLWLPYEAAKVLPIMLNGRLPHKRSFSFKTLKGDLCATFVPEGYTQQSLVSNERRFAKNGAWLQIYVSEEMRRNMLTKIGTDFNEGVDISLPINYFWPEHKFYITVVQEIEEKTD